MDIPERYVWLCLRMGRHLDGFIDMYVGPPEWQGSVAGEELSEPRRLREEARELLDGLAAADLEDDRRRWLRGQLGALECHAARLSGEEMPWAEEVERCLGVRPARTDTGVYADVHRRLDQGLPGSGTVRERYGAWDERNAIPRDRIVPALERLRDVLGSRAHALAPMPPEESVVYELVSGKSWIAYAWYEGEYRTRIEVNADLPVSVVLLLILAAHEAYPGHHTERTAKDARLFRGLGRVETGVAIAPAPESLVSEGLAEIALEEALGPEPFAAVSRPLAEAGVRFDPAQAQELHEAAMTMHAAGTDAAFLIHEDGASTEEAEAYLREWALEPADKAARSVRFITDPATRAYVSAYPDGRRLCRAFADRAPGNFTRLLTEQLTVADLLS